MENGTQVEDVVNAAPQEDRLPPGATPVIWVCDNGHRIKGLLLDGAAKAPPCALCRKKGHNRRGQEVHMVESFAERATVKPVQEVTLSARDELFVVMCQLLDDNRVRMANGQLSEKLCHACEQKLHGNAQFPCACGCHQAWELRRRVEDAAKAV